MADIQLTVTSAEAIEKLAKDLEVYKKTMSFQVFRALAVLEAQIKQNIRSDSGLHVRTGALLNSVFKNVLTQGNSVIGEVGSRGVPYNRIHELGGTIFPKNKQFLAIPAQENRRPDGTPKITTSELMNGLGESFIMNGVIYLISGAGKGNKGNLIPMFYLRKSVEIPARPYVRPALAAKQEEILKNFGLFIRASFGGEKE